MKVFGMRYIMHYRNFIMITNLSKKYARSNRNK